MNSQEITLLVSSIADKARAQKIHISTAESCTGGGIATALTEIAGSSDWFEGGIVSYSNQLKRDLLGVEPEILEQYGAVSEEVALAMVNSVQTKTNTQLSVAVTGIAGPSGGSVDKPVGTVWLAWKIQDEPATATRFLFPGSRSEVRQNSIIEALKGLNLRL
jgi:nicotinamide-nucleotide amidase